MFRKTIVALAAVASLGAVALMPTSASAWHHHHGWRVWGPSIAVGVAAPVYAYDSCYLVKRWVDTDFGPRKRWVRVCS